MKNGFENQVQALEKELKNKKAQTQNLWATLALHIKESAAALRACVMEPACALLYTEVVFLSKPIILTGESQPKEKESDSELSAILMESPDKNSVVI